MYKLGALAALALLYTVYKASNDHSTDIDHEDGLQHVAGRDVGKVGNRELNNLHNPANPLAPEDIKNIRRGDMGPEDKGQNQIQQNSNINSKSDSVQQAIVVRRTLKPELKELLPKNVSLTGANAIIKRAMLEINHRQEILNTERFPKRSDNSIVIVVMVHKRLEYLRFLIESLRKARDIDDALLIFSHDYYSEEINALVTSIDFCQVSVTVCDLKNFLSSKSIIFLS